MKVVGIDTETRGLYGDIHRIGLYYADCVTEEWVWRSSSMSKTEMNLYFDRADWVVGHHLKYDAQVLRDQKGIELPWEKCFDTMVAASILPFEKDSVSLLALSLNHLEGYDGKEDLDLKEWIDAENVRRRKQGLPRIVGEYSEIPDRVLEPYTRQQLLNTLRLFQKWYVPMRDTYSTLFRREMDLQRVILNMQMRGVRISPTRLKRIRKQLKHHMEWCKEVFEYQEEVGFLPDDFNVSSPKQVLELIQDEGFPIESADVANLEAVEKFSVGNLKIFITRLLEYRKCSKLVSTYVDPLGEKSKENQGVRTIHGSFSTTFTTTGRFNSSDPNLQNIPKRTALGRRIRSAFVSRPGFRTFSIDYSQIELRVAASYSGHDETIELLMSGEDFHGATAQKIFKEYDKNDPFYRTAAKNVNFGILYGAGLGRLMSLARLNDVHEASEFRRAYFDAMPGFRILWQKVYSELDAQGYIGDVYGRHYHLTGKGRFAAVNYLVQGTAAGILKGAMRDIDNQLRSEGVSILLTVHDEIAVEIPTSKTSVLLPVVEDLMRGQARDLLAVPMEIEGKEWKPSWEKEE